MLIYRLIGIIFLKEHETESQHSRIGAGVIVTRLAVPPPEHCGTHGRMMQAARTLADHTTPTVAFCDSVRGKVSRMSRRRRKKTTTKNSPSIAMMLRPGLYQAWGRRGDGGERGHS